jgi:hypothetical protein
MNKKNARRLTATLANEKKKNSPSQNSKAASKIHAWPASQIQVRKFKQVNHQFKDKSKGLP